MLKKIVIFGTAEIAQLAHFYFTHDSEYDVVAFTVDDDFKDIDELNGLPVVGFGEVISKFPPSDYGMHVALSYRKLNQLREEKYTQAKQAGYALVSYIASKSVTWPDLKTGDNCFILENQTIQPTVTIGNNVMIWSGNHIGHGTDIGNHSYIASHAVISGHCKIGQRCFFGVNSTLKDFTVVGNDCFIAMDASVTKNLNDGDTVLGAQSSVLPEDDRRAAAIKKSFFGL